MEKFEYKILTYTGKGMLGASFNYEEIEATITGFGLKGWELTSVVNSMSTSNGKAVIVHYFKRKVNE